MDSSGSSPSSCHDRRRLSARDSRSPQAASASAGDCLYVLVQALVVVAFSHAARLPIVTLSSGAFTVLRARLRREVLWFRHEHGTLVGNQHITLGGVLLAQLAAFVLSRSRDRFEDSRRWHEDRRDIYLAVLVGAWAIEHAVHDHFEGDEPLPGDLGGVLNELMTTRMKVRLVGSEKVREVTDDLAIDASKAVTRARAGSSGEALILATTSGTRCTT